ncbi:MAG: hypothetical protein RSC06_00825 [Clostridia bacterium]
MTRVKLGGRELIIDDSELTVYLAMGYSVIDGKGNELSRGKAISYDQAVRENEDMKKRLSKATKDLEALHTERSELQIELLQAQSDLEDANSKYTTLEASIQSKATKSSHKDKSPENEEFGLKTST